MHRRGKRFARVAVAITVSVLIGAAMSKWSALLESWHVHRLETGDEEAQREAAEWLVATGSVEGLYQLTLRAALEEGESASREVWNRTVDEWKLSALESLIRALRHERREVRLLAMGSLTDIGPAGGKAVPALLEALRDPEFSVRRSAVFALRTIGPKARAAIPLLVDLLLDDEIGGAAAFTLGGFGAEAALAIPALIAAVERPSVRYNAVFALGDIGVAAESALQSLLRHPDTVVQAVAEEMVKKLQLPAGRQPNQAP